MTTLTDRMPLSKLAHILYAAAALGSDSWKDGHGDVNRSRSSEGALAEDLSAFFRLLRERRIDYLLVGGVALLKYIEGRNTDDIDIIIAVDSLKNIPELAIQDQNPETARARFRNLRVDLLFTKNPVFRLAQQQYTTTHRFADIEVPCATVEGLVLLKLYALPSLYRQSQLQRAALYETDIAMLGLKHQPKIEPLLAILKPHLNDGEFSELMRIANEIEARIARMKQS